MVKSVKLKRKQETQPITKSESTNTEGLKLPSFLPSRFKWVIAVLALCVGGLLWQSAYI